MSSHDLNTKLGNLAVTFREQAGAARMHAERVRADAKERARLTVGPYAEKPRQDVLRQAEAEASDHDERATRADRRSQDARDGVLTIWPEELSRGLGDVLCLGHAEAHDLIAQARRAGRLRTMDADE